jgi:hypothetical protein
VAGADEQACAQIRDRGGDGKLPRRVDAASRVANASSLDKPDFELAGRERERLRKDGGGLGVRRRKVTLLGKANDSPIRQGQSEGIQSLEDEEEREYGDGAEQ